MVGHGDDSLRGLVGTLSSLSLREAARTDDRLSGLSDDVLVGILSSLSVREAVRTSVLSSRWTNLWRHSFRLNFEGDNTRPMMTEQEKEQMRNKYIDWVNFVLRSHKAPALEEFRICFDLDESNSETITRWLEFAFARRVQRLEFSFLVNGVAFLGTSRMYEFRAEYLRNFDLKPLKALCLRGVNVGGEDIEFLLHNCPFLEELIVQGLCETSKIKVCGSSLALKHLEIFNQSPVKISAPKLTSLKVARLSGLLLENVPMLVEFNLISGGFDFNLDLFKHKLVHVLHRYISQLETLTLGLETTYKESEFCKFPQMLKLNKLVINFVIWYDESYVALHCLMKASPNLQELEVKMYGNGLSREGQKEKSVAHSPHQHLKVLKFRGYSGTPLDVNIVRYILVNCVALQKIIIIDPHWPKPKEDQQQLQSEVPNHIQLLIQ